MNISDHKGYFRLHTIHGCIETIFLAEYEDRILILDGGCNGDVAKIEDYVTKVLGRSMDCVKLVVASHAHPDHMGGASLFKKIYSIPIAAPIGINKWYAGIGGFIQHKIDFMLSSWVVKRNKQPVKSIFYKRNIDFDYPLQDGNYIPFFNDWMVIETPGHTAHDIVLYNQKESILYVSDLFIFINDKFLLPFPVTLPDLLEKSLKRLKPLKVKTMLMAHGGLKNVDDFSEVMGSALSTLNKGLGPFWKKLSFLANFSPEIRKMKKWKKNCISNSLLAEIKGSSRRGDYD